MKLDFSDQLIEKWKVLGKNCKNIHLKLKLLMQKLVKVRNQIFKSLSSLNKIFNESGMAELNEMQDLESLIEMCRIVKESKLIDYHILWKIPRKAEILEEYNENELSN